MIYYAFLSGFVFCCFINGLTRVDWFYSSISFLFSLYCLMNAFVKKIDFKEELKDD